MSGSVPAWTAGDLLSAFQQLLPRGRAWPTDPASVKAQTFAALMPTFARLTARASNLLVDAFPATTVELLPEWQATLGLPDPCAGDTPTLALEQAQVLARFEAGGGQSVAYFIAFAATLGYAITIEQFAPARAGIITAGSPAYGEAWAWVWQVDGPPVSLDYFTVGISTVGQGLATFVGSDVLQCEIRRLSPAHTDVLFSYASEFSSDFTSDFI